MAPTRPIRMNGAPASKVRHPIHAVDSENDTKPFQQKRKTTNHHPATNSTSHKDTDIARMRYSYPMVYRSRVAKTTKKQPPASELLRRINRSKTADASRQAVLNTTELLENIVSFIPPFNILAKAQRVSSGWKDTIAASPTVQTLVWKPRVAHILSPSAYSHEIEATRNDKRAKLQFGWYIAENSSIDVLAFGVPKYSEAAAFQELFFNGLRPRPDEIEEFTDLADLEEFAELDAIDKYLAVSIERIPIGYLHSAEMDWADDLINPSHETRQTWLDRHITSPPITAAQMCVWVQPVDFMGNGFVYATVYDPRGITYGTAVEVLKKMNASDNTPADEKYAGFTSISFVTDALAPGSTLSWNPHGFISNWDQNLPKRQV
jgi:hypothetical protein